MIRFHQEGNRLKQHLIQPFVVLLLLAGRLSAAEPPAVPVGVPGHTNLYARLPAQPDCAALAASAKHWTEPFDQTERDPGGTSWVYFPATGRPLRGVSIAPYKGSVDPRPAMDALQFAWIFSRWDQHTGPEWLHLERDGEKFLRPYLRALGQRFNHPELEHLPIFVEGYQGEEAPVWRDLFAKMPGQLVAVMHGWSYKHQTPEFRQSVPYLRLDETVGKGDKFPWEQASSRARGRAPGELYCQAIHFDFGHGMWGKQVMHWMFMDQMMKARVPFDVMAKDRPLGLLPVREQDGWLGDADYMTAGGGNWTDKIAPFAQYTGDKANAVWLPSEWFAWVWRANGVKNDTPIEIAGPVTRYKRGGPVRNARGETFDCGLGIRAPFAPDQKFDITVELRTNAAAIAKVEFHDGHLKLGESTQAPFRLTGVTLPAPGIHALIAVATLTDGARASSHPAPLAVLGDMYAGATYGARHHGNGAVAGAQPPLRWWRFANLLWTATLPGTGAALPVPYGNRLHTLCEPNQLVALDTRTGQVLWQQTLPGRGADLTPLVSRDAVFTMQDSGHLAAHHTGTGALLWSATVAPGQRPAAPLLCGTVLVTTGEQLTGFDARSGRQLWRVATTTATPEKAWHDGGYVVLTGAGLAVRAADGTVVTDKLPRTTTAPVVADGVAYFAGEKITAVRLDDFQTLWSVNGAPIVGAPVIADGLLYTLSANQQLTAREAANGHTVYAERLGQEACPAGHLIALPGRIYAVNLGASGRTAIVKTGRQFAVAWEYFTKPGAASPTFGGDRQYVRVGARLHAVGGKDPAPPVAPVFVRPTPLAMVPAGATTTPLVIDQAPAEWLTLGPLPNRDLETDHLTALQGRARAVPVKGATVELGGRHYEFAPLATNKWNTGKHTGNVPVITLIAGAQKLADHPSIGGTNFNSTTYLFTVLQTDAPRYVKLSIWSPGQFDNRKDLDYRAWLGGQQVTERDVIRLEAGAYPFLVQATVGTVPPWGLGWIRPHFVDAAGDGAAIQENYDKATALWPKYAEESTQPFTLD